MERFATPIVPTLCYIESGNVALTQPIMITYIEDEMELEKEAKAFMDRRSREPKTMFELLTEMNYKLKECENGIRDINDSLKKLRRLFPIEKK
jgi:riboflavin synthase